MWVQLLEWELNCSICLPLAVANSSCSFAPEIKEKNASLAHLLADYHQVTQSLYLSCLIGYRSTEYELEIYLEPSTILNNKTASLGHLPRGGGFLFQPLWRGSWRGFTSFQDRSLSGNSSKVIPSFSLFCSLFSILFGPGPIQVRL